MKPPAPTIDYAPFLSQSAKRWKMSGIRGLLPLESIPGMISLLAGKPNPHTFPFESITIGLKDSVVLSSSSSTTSTKDVTRSNMPKHLTISGSDLEEALQYGATRGLPQLVRWIEAFQKHCHRQNVDDSAEHWRCSIGAGSSDLLCKLLASVCNPGETLLLESPTYPGSLGFARHTQVHMVEIPCDISGICVDKLQMTLSQWHTDPQTSSLPFPKVLYTIPVGSNPSGSSALLERKLQVLELCREHNLLIVEDDPYFHLHYDKSLRAPSYFELDAHPKSTSPAQPTTNLVPTGRVIRLDSLSKILSSGMRVGFITGPKAILDYVDLHSSNTTLQPSSLSQMVIYALLEQWGIEGFLSHIDRVAAFYKEQHDMASRAASRHLNGLAEWDAPVAGMFLWIKLLIPAPHPSTSDNTPDAKQAESEGDSQQLILEKALERGVLAVPGTSFIPSGSTSAYVRTSFSMLKDEEEANEAFKRLASVVRDFRRGHGLPCPPEAT